MNRFFKFLRPMAYLRRKAVMAGVLGGSRKWLVWGGFAWVFHWLGRILGSGEATPRYTEDLAAGEQVVVVHESKSPLEIKKAAKRAAKAQRKAQRAS